MRALTARLRRHAAAERVGPQTVSMAERTVLRCLAEAPGPLSLSAVADCIHRDASSVCVVAHRLSVRRLVQKRSDPEDRRRVLLSTTAKGRRAAEETPDGAGDALARAVAAAPLEQVRTATALLGQLAAALPALR